MESLEKQPAPRKTNPFKMHLSKILFSICIGVIRAFLTLWMLGCCNFKNPGNFPSSQAEGDPETLLREFFQQNADANRPGHSDSSDAVMTWLGGHGNRADFRGSKECWNSW